MGGCVVEVGMTVVGMEWMAVGSRYLGKIQHM